MNRNKLGQALRQLRGMRDLGQKQIGLAVHLSPTTICHLETGQKKSYIGTYAKYCRALEFPMGLLQDILDEKQLTSEQLESIGRWAVVCLQQPERLNHGKEES